MRDVKTPLERIAAALECIAGRYSEERERLLQAVAVELHSALRHIDDEPQRAGSKIACALSNLEQFAGRELGAQERASEDALIGHIDPSLWGPPCDVCKHRRLVHWGQCCVSGCECAGYIDSTGPRAQRCAECGHQEYLHGSGALTPCVKCPCPTFRRAT